MSLFRLFCDFEGRIGLRTFWAASAAIALTLFAAQRIAPLLLTPQDARFLSAFLGAFALFPWAALAAKRAVDRGGSSLFGILLVCAIVVPDMLRPHLPFGWRASLEAIATIAWLIALVDLGLMPSAQRAEPALAGPAGAAKPAE